MYRRKYIEKVLVTRSEIVNFTLKNFYFGVRTDIIATNVYCQTLYSGGLCQISRSAPVYSRYGYCEFLNMMVD